MAAQVAHGASHGSSSSFFKWFQPNINLWKLTGASKIVLAGKDEEHLKDLKKQAQTLGLNTKLVRDAGLTEIAPLSTTVLAIGPNKSDDIDKVTGTLKTVHNWPHKQKNWTQ